MELFRVIKSDARRAMRFCGGRAIASLMIIALAYLAINLTETVVVYAFTGEIFYTGNFYSGREYAIIAAVFSAIWLLVIPPLWMGYIKLHLSFAEGNDESINTLFDMFSGFKKFIGSVVFFIEYGIRVIIIFAFAVLPGGAFLWFAENYIPTGNRTAEMLKISACCVAIAIMILCIALAIIFIQRWSLAPFYRVRGYGIIKSFTLSAKAAKGCCTKIISFKFSFVGWWILSVLVLPMIWTAPYYALSNAIYAKYLMERYEHSLAEVPEIIEEPSPSEEDADSKNT